MVRKIIYFVPQFQFHSYEILTFVMSGYPFRGKIEFFCHPLLIVKVIPDNFEATINHEMGKPI